MSKGSKRRPRKVSDERFRGNWDRIFTKLVPEGSYLDVHEVGMGADASRQRKKVVRGRSDA